MGGVMMSNFCKKCGTELNDDAKFCTSCGERMEQEVVVRRNITGNSFPGISKRSIPLAIILSIVTCAIYTLYWEVKLTDEMNTLLGKTNATSGVMALIYTIITCGIYGIYWLYKMGQNVDEVKGKTGDTGILYLILGFIGLGIIPLALIQDTINDKLDGVY